MSLAIARCNKNDKFFAIRFNQNNEAIWSFNLDSEALLFEANSEKISGDFSLAGEYPGCPHCGNNSFFLCGCGTLNCWDGSPTVCCHKCNYTGGLKGSIKSLETKRDG